MSIKRYTTADGRVRFRVRLKVQGKQITSRVFDRRADAIAWEQDQTRGMRVGEWMDPRRGKVTLSQVADDWLISRGSVKRRSRESDEAIWRLHVKPTFGDLPLTAITQASVATWVGKLSASGAAASSVSRYLATLRSILSFAEADGRVTRNVAARVKAPRGAHTRREGQFLSLTQLRALANACHGDYADVVLVLGLTGIRWGELAGLQVGDLVTDPGPGLRLQRAVLTSRADGKMFVDTLKTSRSRTVPLVEELVPVVAKWAAGKSDDDWLYGAPLGGPLSGANWKRSVRWTEATIAIGKPKLRVHDLRHTAASLWLAAGADPKVIQRILGHASAVMTMDLYGHLSDENLWHAAARVGESGDISGTFDAFRPHDFGQSADPCGA